MAAKKKPAAPMMPYTGNTDPATGPRPGTVKLVDILTKGKMKMSNLGIWANRPMRGSTRLSVHATGRAFDAGFPAARKEWASLFFDWVVLHHEALGCEELHEYSYGKWGRGFRCSRKELGGEPGVKIWTETDNGGTPGGLWLHWEVKPAFADDPVAMEKAWRDTIAAFPPPWP